MFHKIKQIWIHGNDNFLSNFSNKIFVLKQFVFLSICIILNWFPFSLSSSQNFLIHRANVEVKSKTFKKRKNSPSRFNGPEYIKFNGIKHDF